MANDQENITGKIVAEPDGENRVGKTAQPLGEQQPGKTAVQPLAQPVAPPKGEQRPGK